MRLVIATHAGTSSDPAVGTLRDGIVYELFVSTLPSPAFTASDILELYLHRGSFETVLADEDKEQDANRWYSHTPWGQEFAQIIAQWSWNIRRTWLKVVRSQTICLESSALLSPPRAAAPTEKILTRAERAHWRLSWDQRLARNARPTDAPRLIVTLHGLPATFASAFGFDLLATA